MFSFYLQAYKFVKLIIAEAYEFYANMDPHLKKRFNQAKNLKNKTKEF